MQILRALLRLTRLDSSLLAFCSIFIPCSVRSNDLAQSLRRAIPLLFIFICTFIANDLDDIEKDQVNHPDRPLPTGQLTATFATVLYFTSLALALFSTKYFVAPDVAFLYYALIALTISYGYLVDCLPGLKAPYVAAVSTIPILIVATSYANDPRLLIVAASFFLFNMGRELCMDIKDRAGDALSFMHRLGPKPLATVAFVLQTIGLLLLAIQIRKVADLAALVAITILLARSAVDWFNVGNYKRAVILMKLPFFVGLYFLT